LISAFINDIEVDKYGTLCAIAGTWSTNITTVSSFTIQSGQTKEVVFWIDPNKKGSTLSSGTTINIKIHSAGGMDYLKLVELV
jgi:hypothetical protein